MNTNTQHEPRIPEQYLTDAHDAIAAVTAEFPELSCSGWVPDPLREPFSQACVATALAYLDCGPVLRAGISNRRKWSSSYWLKHRAEDWGGMLGLAPYVSNGDLICAVLWRG